jgi:hypothetical protein
MSAQKRQRERKKQEKAAQKREQRREKKDSRETEVASANDLADYGAAPAPFDEEGRG